MDSGMIHLMTYTNTAILCGLMLVCCSIFIIIPAHAFTANSLDITVDEKGDAIATFRFTLEGIIENAIPQSVLEEELKKGLTTSSEPPELKSMDKSSAVLLMKGFADTSDVPTGKEYRTATMDFKKAEIALQNSALSSAVSADFSPEKITLTFPDSYKKEYTNVDVLPAVFHTVEDPAKVAALAAAQVQASNGSAAAPGVTAAPASTGSINVTSSPQNVKVFLDAGYIGESPAVFPEIAPGTHAMEFSKDGFSTIRKNVTVNAGRTTNVMVVLTYIPPTATEDTSSFPWVPLLVVIIGLAVIATGGYYYWSEKKKKEWSDVGEAEPEYTRNPDRAGKNPVIKNIVIKDREINDTPPQNTVVKTSLLKDSAAETRTDKNPVLKDTAGKNTAPGNTVVKVTILKDIPEKETGMKDTKDREG
jgi:hypothetical protein